MNEEMRELERMQYPTCPLCGAITGGGICDECLVHERGLDDDEKATA